MVHKQGLMAATILAALFVVNPASGEDGDEVEEAAQEAGRVGGHFRVLGAGLVAQGVDAVDAVDRIYRSCLDGLRPGPGRFAADDSPGVCRVRMHRRVRLLPAGRGRRRGVELGQPVGTLPYVSPE